MPKVINQSVHDNLVSLGYAHTNHPDDTHDNGDGESGPDLYWCPEFDEYESADHRIVVDHHGQFAMAEDRDLAFEAFCESMMEGVV